MSLHISWIFFQFLEFLKGHSIIINNNQANFFTCAHKMERNNNNLARWPTEAIWSHARGFLAPRRLDAPVAASRSFLIISYFVWVQRTFQCGALALTTIFYTTSVEFVYRTTISLFFSSLLRTCLSFTSAVSLIFAIYIRLCAHLHPTHAYILYIYTHKHKYI